MSKQKNKNSLLSGHSRASLGTAAKDELLAMKYVMEKPLLPIYPLGVKNPKAYPDFCPWDEPDLKNEKLSNSNYLNKGYFESPLVANEYYSARNLIQETLFTSLANCNKLLSELLLNLTKSFKRRNEAINKIPYGSASFKLPPRVTLTALKREAWLKDLANLNVPLLQVSIKIPHGIRNKVLIECMCNSRVPINRAIWFTKCVLYNEQLLIRKKLLLKVTSSKVATAVEIMESHWISEWTLHVSDYLLKFSRDMETVSSPDRKAQYQEKLLYLLSFVKTLYIECLIDKTAFLSAAINFLREDQPFLQEDLLLLLELSRIDSEDHEASALNIISKLKPLNYGQTLLGLTVIKTFWVDILKEDFLCKATNEALLLNFFLIDKIAAVEPLSAQRIGDCPYGVPNELKQNMLLLISSSVCTMFRYNSNVFIVPDFWILIGDVLYRILMNDSSMADQKQTIESILKLINYRNESLMLNMKYSFKHKKLPSSRGAKASRKNSFLLPAVQSGRIKNISSALVETDFTCLGGSKKDILRFINQLDRNKLNNFLMLSLTPKRPSDNGYSRWKTRVKVAVYWCATVYRDMGAASVRILTLCNFLKRKVVYSLTGRGSSQLKAELENEILESVFALALEPRSSIFMRNLYVLINELYQLKIITISSYLRKIIACGIFYVSSESTGEIDAYLTDPLVGFHLSILQNLPVLNNKQCDHILKKWTRDGSSFTAKFNRGIELAQKHIVDAIVNSDFGLDYDQFLDEIYSLDMGVKFLVVNWLTTKIKDAISKSPKLVHFSPVAMARIYRFYEKTDNLTVFFKVLVKFVLRNENKVIIFYLETLYFICKLSVSHFSLIKLIAGQTHETSSTASELFKLVLLCYKDILSRESDVYRFLKIWDFIAKSTERPSTVGASIKDTGLNSLLFDKETADSPLSIPAHASRRQGYYSPEDFHADLASFQKVGSLFLTEEEIDDCFAEVQMPPKILSHTQFCDPKNYENTILILLSVWFPRTSIPGKESVDLAYYKLIEQTRKKIKILQGDEFFSAISSFFLSRPQQQCNLQLVATFLRKLVSYELFLIGDLLTMIENFGTDDSFWRNLISEILFGGPDSALLCNQNLMYQVLLNEYKENSLEHLFAYAIEDMKHEPSKNYQNQLAVVMSNLILNQRVSLESLIKCLDTNTILRTCTELIGAQSGRIDILALIYAADTMPNEFSLPVWQLLLHVIISDTRPTNDMTGSTAFSIIARSRFLFGLKNSFFGELFDQIGWEYRLELFYFMEESFFHHCKFDTERTNGVNSSGALNDEFSQNALVLFYMEPVSTDLLPVVKDFFKKFSCPLIERIETLPALLRHISQFLSKLVRFLNLEVVKHLSQASVYDAVSIFLRLLIIHNASLTEHVGRSEYIDLQFFHNLVELHNSEYLSSSHEKLQILLYDLLLMMKSSLTQILTVFPNETLLETLPEASSDEMYADYKRSYDGSVATVIIGIVALLNLPEPKTSVFHLSEVNEPQCIVTLDEEELSRTSDICIVNNKKLEITHSVGDTLNISSPLGTPKVKPKKLFAMKSVALIENPSFGPNNGCFNLALFNAYTTKENPL